jgi:hypothetical protein
MEGPEPRHELAVHRNIPTARGLNKIVLSTRSNPFGMPALCLLLVVLLGSPGCAHAPPKSSASDFYEMTAQAWPDNEICPKHGLLICGIVKPRVPFLLAAEDSDGNQLRVSGTVKERSPEDFYIEKIKGKAYGSTFSANSTCDSKETMDRRKAMQALPGADHPRDEEIEQPEGNYGLLCFPGPGFSLTLKRKQSSTTTELPYWLDR